MSQTDPGPYPSSVQRHAVFLHSETHVFPPNICFEKDKPNTYIRKYLLRTAVNYAESTPCAHCCTVSLHAIFAACSFYCAEFCCLQLFLQIASLRVNSFGQSSAEIYCTQFSAHVFDTRRLDAQSFATLLYYTIAIQLHNYTSATLLHDCHSKVKISNMLRAAIDTGNNDAILH